jgi:cyclophilin family peptidyl-prolyl cis-trans isomerase
MTTEATKQYIATLRTEKGDIVIELNAEKATETVNNFVNLAQRGFYNGTTFHRVLADFMAQGGDPTGTGAGGPGYTINDEFSDLAHDRGVISMANTGRPNTGGSQWFITLVPTPWLDGKHAVFGKVTSGMEVVDALTLRDPSQNPSFPGDTLVEVLVEERG